MTAESTNKYISRLILNFSDLCSNDAEVAKCLNFMRIPTPTGINWTAESARESMPSAYSTLCHTSEYALPAAKTFEHCEAIYRAICGDVR